MAGDDDRDRVPPVGGTDGTRLADVTAATGLLAVADRLAERDRAQRPPPLELEGRPDGIEGDVEADTFTGEVLVQLRRRGGEVSGRIRSVDRVDGRGPVVAIGAEPLDVAN